MTEREDIEATLRKLVANSQRTLTPQQIRAHLSDLVPYGKKHNAAIVRAAETGETEKIPLASPVERRFLFDKAVQSLVEDSGLDESLSRWAVSAWFRAYQVEPPDIEVQSPAPRAAEPASKPVPPPPQHPVYVPPTPVPTPPRSVPEHRTGMYVASLIAVFVVGGAGYKLLNPSRSAPLASSGETARVAQPAPVETGGMETPEGSNFDAPAVKVPAAESPLKRRRRRTTPAPTTTPEPAAPVASDAFVTHTFPRFTIDAPERFSESSQVRATWMRYALKTEDGIEVQIDRSPRGSGPLDQLSAPTGFDKTWSKKADYQRFRLDNDTFQGRPSVVFEFERKQDDRMVHKKITYFATDEHTWAIVLMTPLARWDASKGELERIEATFRAL